MQKVIKKTIACILGATFFFLAGMFVGPNGSNIQKKMKNWRYTKTAAQKLYSEWDKNTLFFESSNESLASFAEKNETFILYNWATWCPHCKNINESLQELSNVEIPTIALTFDTDWDSYRLYRQKTNPFWKDLVQHDSNGEEVFTPRKDEFDVPLIPSVWIIKNGKVMKIFIGEKGAKKLFSWLKNQNLLKN